MKVLWISEYNLPTGFARVSKSLIKQLQKRLDITVLDWYEDKDSFVGGVKVLGKKTKLDAIGIQRMLDIYQQYDAIFILNDVWNIAKYLNAIKQGRSKTKHLPKIFTYFPVDARQHNPDWYTDFNIVTEAVTYTNFAVDAICEAVNSNQTMNCAFNLSVIPHGIDGDVFFKSQSDKSAIREHVYNTNQLNDAFVFFNGNRNQPRKRLDITVRAFSEFLKSTKATDAYLHLHCGLLDYGLNIPELVKHFGVSDYVIVSGQEEAMQNVSSEMLNLYYNASDVGLNSSLGEGWGLVNVEHGMTGAPQIVPNHSACAEIYNGNAMLIDSPTEILFYESLTIGNIPDYKHMAVCMEKYYSDKRLRKKDGGAIKKHFSSPLYSWTSIAEQWFTLFNKKADQ